MLLVGLAVLAPVLSLLVLASQGSSGHWANLLEYVLPHAFVQTLWLLAGVGAVSAALGVGGAWLVTAFDFPGRTTLSWALMLPLAVPTYIVAYAYLDILHPIGPVQSAVRWVLGYDSPRDFRLPDLRNLPGAILLMGFVLYPYVYLTARSMFATQAASLIEAARLLGHGPRSTFLRIVLPLARPAVAVGLSLVLLETLNDIGASEFLGIQTLTVSVYTTWVSRSDLGGAAQIALLMLVLVVVLIALERHGRQRLRYSAGRGNHPIRPRQLTGARAWLATALGAWPVVVGFLVPAAYLLMQSVKRFLQDGPPSMQLLRAGVNTVGISLLAMVMTVVLGLVVAWSAHIMRRPQRWRLALPRLATLGYALPGTVLAIGLLFPVTALDQVLVWVRGFMGLEPARQILMASPWVLALAYAIRFLTISVGSIEAGLMRIPPSIEQAARLLNETLSGTLRRIHLPLLKPALATAALLVFVDSMKELPATLLLRPMNFETLATWLYGEAARGTYDEGAIAALAIVLSGLIPVILLSRLQQQNPYTHHA